MNSPRRAAVMVFSPWFFALHWGLSHIGHHAPRGRYENGTVPFAPRTRLLLHRSSPSLRSRYPAKPRQATSRTAPRGTVPFSRRYQKFCATSHTPRKSGQSPVSGNRPQGCLRRRRSPGKLISSPWRIDHAQPFSMSGPGTVRPLDPRRPSASSPRRRRKAMPCRTQMRRSFWPNTPEWSS